MYYIAQDRFGNYDLSHGKEWKNHKYIRKEGTRYIYSSSRPAGRNVSVSGKSAGVYRREKSGKIEPIKTNTTSARKKETTARPASIVPPSSNGFGLTGTVQQGKNIVDSVFKKIFNGNISRIGLNVVKSKSSYMHYAPMISALLVDYTKKEKRKRSKNNA